MYNVVVRYHVSKYFWVGRLWTQACFINLSCWYHRPPQYIGSFGLIWHLKNTAKHGDRMRSWDIPILADVDSCPQTKMKKQRSPSVKSYNHLSQLNRLLNLMDPFAGLWKLGPGSSCPWVARCFAGLHCVTTPRETSHTWGLQQHVVVFRFGSV